MGLRLFLCNINWDATEAEFREWLTVVQGYEVVDLKMITHHETGRPKGFAFATFKTEDDAADAMKWLEGELFMERPIHVAEATEKGSTPRNTGRWEREQAVREQAVRERSSSSSSSEAE